MGMYTELAVNIDLREDTPPDIIDRLKRREWPVNSGGSYYFNGVCRFEISELDTVSKTWHMLLWTNIKDSSLWVELLDSLAPHIDGGRYGPEYIGHYRYEESVLPTLLFIEKGEIKWVEPTDAAEVLRIFNEG